MNKIPVRCTSIKPINLDVNKKNFILFEIITVTLQVHFLHLPLKWTKIERPTRSQCYYFHFKLVMLIKYFQLIVTFFYSKHDNLNMTFMILCFWPWGIIVLCPWPLCNWNLSLFCIEDITVMTRNKIANKEKTTIIKNTS